MIKKSIEKKFAIQLRKQGFSYNEILQRVGVSKSTLSIWLRSIGISRQHKQRFTEKRRLAQKKAQESCRNTRIKKSVAIIESAKKEVSTISRKDLWLLGTSLYWAEGTKQKKHNVSQRVSFGNSDPKMVILFDRWIQEICDCKRENLVYMIYIHRTANQERARKFWENLLNVKIGNVYFKNHSPKTNRKNVDKNYYGLLRIDVRKSTDLNRRIHGWILGITEKLQLTG